MNQLRIDCIYLRIVKVENCQVIVKCSKGLLKDFKCPTDCPYYRKFGFSGFFILLFVLIGAFLGLLFSLEFSILGILIGGISGYCIERLITLFFISYYSKILTKCRIVIQG